MIQPKNKQEFCKDINETRRQFHEAGMNICGFMIVRKPSENYDLAGEGIWPRQAPRIGRIFYGGAWRLPWIDVEDDIRGGKLPIELKDAYRTHVSDLQGSGFALCGELEIANQLLIYCNREMPRCELIAVHSPRLAALKGVMAVDENSLTRCGIEPFQIGGGSLLVDGVFSAPEHFPNWRERLNGNGLLASQDESERYVVEYQWLVNGGLLEEIFPLEQCPIDPVEIFTCREMES